MKKKYLLLMISLLFVFGTSRAQGLHERPIGSLDDIREFLENHYKVNSDSAYNNCWQGCVFLRFSLSKDQKLIDIDYSKSTPPFIKDALLAAVIELNKQIFRIKELKVTIGKTFLLPFVIDSSEGCGIDNWDVQKHDNKVKAMYEERQIHANRYVETIRNMLNFSKEKSEYLNCIVLSPAMPPITMH